MSIELIAIVVVAIIALGVYLLFHKDTETKLLAAVNTAKFELKADLATKLVDVNTYLKAHGTSLDDIEGLLTAHGLSLATLEDKAKNVLTEIETSKAVQRIEDAAKTAKAEIDKVLGTVPAVAAAAAPATIEPPAAVAALVAGTAPATA